MDDLLLPVLLLPLLRCTFRLRGTTSRMGVAGGGGGGGLKEGSAGCIGGGGGGGGGGGCFEELLFLVADERCLEIIMKVSRSSLYLASKSL